MTRTCNSAVAKLQKLSKADLIWCILKDMENIGRCEKLAKQSREKRLAYNDLIAPYVGKPITEIPKPVIDQAVELRDRYSEIVVEDFEPTESFMMCTGGLRMSEVFQNFKEEFYEGNAPCGKGHRLVGGGYSDRWETRWGGEETKNDEILYFSFSLNHKVNIFICGDALNITDFRYAGECDSWVFCNKPEKTIYGTFVKKFQHPLEPERVERYLDTEIPNCKIWTMVQKRAKELYSQWKEETKTNFEMEESQYGEVY